MLDKIPFRSALAEFLGTGILVMVALVLTETTAVSYFIATSVALTLAAVYMLFSQVSGAQINPAVTFGMWAARLTGTVRAICYIIAQFLGGFAALALYQFLINHHIPARTSTYSSWHSWLPVIVGELVGTVVLTMGYAAALTKGLTALESALTYGASLFVGIMIAATAAAGYLNPAVALGLHGLNWVYVVGPLLGGLVGIGLFTYIFGAGPRLWNRATFGLATKKRK